MGVLDGPLSHRTSANRRPTKHGGLNDEARSNVGVGYLLEQIVEIGVVGFPYAFPDAVPSEELFRSADACIQFGPEQPG
jgi:hypothetical protein